MIKRLLKSKLPLIVYNPTQTFDMDYFKESFSSGALPVFDTEFYSNDEIIEKVKELSKEDILFGLRLYVKNQEVIEYLHNNTIINLDLIVFAYSYKDELSSFSFINKNYTFFIEVVDEGINDLLDAINPHGVIVKGKEAPGKVSKFTSFILMQWYLRRSHFPVYVHGGVGMYTAAGMFAAGASGIVLDNQLYLAEEAPLSPKFKELVATLEENDSTIIGQTLKVRYHFFSKLGTRIVKDLRNFEISLDVNKDGDDKLYAEIKSKIESVGEDSTAPLQSLIYMGQDAVFAKHFVKKSSKLQDIINDLFSNISEQLSVVDEFDPLVKDSPLAKEHGTSYPIIQGPKANITDNSDFAKAVHDAGGLPFFAMGSLPADIADDILKSGKEKVPSFGAGLIGIEAFNKQAGKHIELTKQYKVPFALFAGGIPAQVKDLEEAGTKTYLHTPSSQMLENAIEKGCSRVIFEGTEAGGHVGSLTSMILWEMGMSKLMNMSADVLNGKSIIFAGGISSKTASSFVSGMSSILAARGAKVGVQLGTMYLFTDEIVETGALKKLYQDVIIKGNETILIGNTVGLNARTLPTPFTNKIIENENNRLFRGMNMAERKEAFEHDNLGSLMIGAKAFYPVFKDDGKVSLKHCDEDEQYKRGNFMVGDGLLFERESIKIYDIHDRIVGNKDEMFHNLNQLEVFSSKDHSINDEIAIVGLGFILPESDTPEQLWEHIINKKYMITEMPKERFDSSFYYSKDRKTEDTSYSRIAGQIPDYNKVFDYKKYGYTKKEADGMTKSQKALLEAATRCIKDAGYLDTDEFTRKKTAVVMGTCLANEMSNDLELKYFYPEYKAYLDQIDEFKALDEKSKKAIFKQIKDNTTFGYDVDTIEGTTLNIEASRIAKHLGIKGVTYTVDAACATSFAAIDSAMKELQSGRYDYVVTGGMNTNLSPETFVSFAKMGALSGDGSYPFDERANGFVLGEGIGCFLLKRVKDAVRDGNKIYAVIKGMGSSSDGKGKFIAAPKMEGQEYALKRCYENVKSDVKVEDIDYIEAHGTSTKMGDKTEVATLKTVYNCNRQIGVSSIKSQIGHLLGGSGAAGLIKVLLAMKHKTLPPNGQFEKLSPACELQGSNLYIIEDPKPWDVAPGKPRTAAVSSYGFGGINFHCVVAEYTENYKSLKRNIFSDLDFDFNENRVVISAIGVKFPGIDGPDQLWEALAEGRSVLKDIPDEFFHNKYFAEEEDPKYRFPMTKAGVVEGYKPDFRKYRTPPMAAKAIDKAQFFALETTGQIIEQVGLEEGLVDGNKTAVFIGTSVGERRFANIVRTRLKYIMSLIENTGVADPALLKTITEKLKAEVSKKYPASNEDTNPGMLSNIVSGRVANFYGFNGPNFIIDSSAASSAIAGNLAMQGLQSGEFDYAIAGGIDANITPNVMRRLHEMGLLADSDVKVFDKNSRGLNVTEGSVLFLATTYKKAREKKMPVLAELNGIRFSGVVDGFIEPHTDGFKRSMEKLYLDLPINKEQIDYLDLNGLGNAKYDANELASVEKGFVNAVAGNTKANFGYLPSAEGAFAIAKMVLVSQHKSSLIFKGYDKPNSLFKSSVLKAGENAVSLDKQISIKSAANIYGFGPNHGHAVVSTLPVWLEQVKHGRVSQTAQAAAPQVAVAVGPKTAQPVAAAAIPAAASGSKRVVALLSGQGAQRNGMMKELYDSSNIIRALMDKGNAIFQEVRGYSLLDIMFGNDDKINSTDITQPAIFISSVAIFEYLKMKGFNPDLFIGHSLGEYSALYCAGVLNFEDAMKLIIKRSELMMEAARNNPGKMIVLFKNAVEAESYIKANALTNVYVTNKNSNKQTVISGVASEIDTLCSYLDTNKIMYTRLKLSGAFHTPLFNSAAVQLREYINGLTFNNVDMTRIISNVTAAPYPQDVAAVKELLVNQVVSPVEFVRSVEFAHASGAEVFVEVGPNRILINLTRDIETGSAAAVPAVDPRKGERESFEALMSEISNYVSPQRVSLQTQAFTGLENEEDLLNAFILNNEDDDMNFRTFLKENQEHLKHVLHREYLLQQKVQDLEKFDFYTGSIVVAGTSVGLPGSSSRVFNDDNFDKLLAGNNFIEQLSPEEQQAFLDKNIVKVLKDPQGNARFVEINSSNDVIHLAGKLGYFDLKTDYGIDFDYDIVTSLSIAAGVEALKDAGIPLVRSYKRTSTGNLIPSGYCLPEEMQDDTGVIFTSIFSGLETIINQLTDYYHDKFKMQPYKEFEQMYYFLMEKVQNPEAKEKLTNWFFALKNNIKEEKFVFDRNILFKIIPLGSAHFAQILKAKGPNTMISSACASSTQAMGVAEDWIRAGRCKRVIIVGADAGTTNAQNPWVGSGFLAMGAASVKKTIPEAVKPFDENRNGMVVGSGALGMIIERSDSVEKRGLKGQVEVLGTYIGNSAFHGSKIDVQHLANEMNRFVGKIEKRHGLDRKEFAKSMIFMSHETYTPARGGSASAEVEALKKTFINNYKEVIITNTKGYTGHTLGAAIEDPVLIKALQKGIVPPIPNLVQIPAEFADLNFSKGNRGNYQYGMHLSAGFGSHFSFVFMKRLDEASRENNAVYNAWLQKITKTQQPKLVIKNNTLCVEAEGAAVEVASARAPEIAKPAVARAVPPVASPVPVAAPVASPVAPVSPPVAPAAPVVPAAAAAAPAAGGRDSGAVMASIKNIIAEQTGYTQDMLEDDLDLEADLGIDTVKQVEIFGAITSHFDVAVPEDLKLSELNTINKIAVYMTGHAGGAVATASAAPAVQTATVAPAPVQAGGVDTGSIKTIIKNIIAEQTGYTQDMLEDDLDLEADLGVDTVKQVEIFGSITSHFNVTVPEDLKLSELNTIDRIAVYMGAQLGATTAPAAAPAVASAPVATPAQTAISAVSTESLIATIKNIIAEQTGYEVDMLEDDLDLEADLGVDTVKQVEIFGSITSHFNVTVPEDLKLSELNTIAKISHYINENVGGEVITQSAAAPQPAAATPVAQPAAVQAASVDTRGLVGKIKSIIADQTGYEVDMLEEDLDLEADLGVDTVKQVEIFGAITSEFNVTVPEDLKLSELNTIAKIADYMAKETGMSAAPAPTVPAAPSVAVAQPAVAAPAAPAGAVDGSGLIGKIKEIIAAQTGYEVDMLEDDLDLEADLGVDTVKQVEIFGAITSEYNISVPEDLKLSELNTISKIAGYIASQISGGTPGGGAAVPAPTAPAASAPAPVASAPASSGASSDLKAKIKEIIAAQTGYEVDMLEDDLDLEADLGVDTVKQVEIFGAITSEYNVTVPEDLKLSELNTIAKIADYMAQETGMSAGASAAPASQAAVAAPAVAPAAPVASPASVSAGTDTTGLTAKIKEIISAQTGYEVDMLEDDLDLEADLGVDTVKQVEIFGAITSEYNVTVPEDLKLSELNTIAKIAEYMAKETGAGSALAAAPAQPATAVPVATAAPVSSPAAGGSAALAVKIKEIISAQTGYEVDMLEDDLDLEADLGVDTVKQVEIFGAITSEYNVTVPEDLKLSELNTISKIADYMAKETGMSAAPAPAPAAAPQTAVAAPASAPAAAPVEESGPEVLRFISEVVKTEPVSDTVNVFENKKFLVTPDKHGFAKKIIEAIRKKGGTVVTMGSADKDDIKVDMTDQEAFEKTIIEVASQYTDLNGFLHFKPLDYYFTKSEVNEKELNASVKAYFMAVKHLYGILDKKDNLLSTLTFESVVFPYKKDKGNISPTFAAVNGMMKTINKEMRDVLVRVVDFSDKDPKKNIDKIVQTYITELCSGETRVEVGYKGKERYVIAMKDVKAEEAKSFVKDGDTILVTGGAGGITYEIIKRVAQEYKNLQLIVCDLMDINQIDKEFLADNVDEKYVLGKLKSQMAGAKPLEVKKAAERTMRVRQGHRNIEFLKTIANVDYNPVNVLDSKAVSAVVKKYDKIDGVLHAAGMEISQFIPKMDLGTFNLVFDVKVTGILNLLKALKEKDYGYFLTFSSVTARFGNEGQVNYTAANEFLSKMMYREKLANPKRSYKAYAWTAWGGVGMAMNPTVKKVLEDRGLAFLPMEQGIQYFVDDLKDHKYEEMTFTGISPTFDVDKLINYDEKMLYGSIRPFLDNLVEKTADKITFTRVLDLDRDIFLFDHQREGVPIFLGATGVEAMAEAAAELAPEGYHLTEVRSLQIPYGIKILKGRPKEIIIEAKKGSAPDTYDCVIKSQFKNKQGVPMGDETLHYHASYTFSKNPLADKTIEIPKYHPVEIAGGESFQDMIYHPRRLFMDGLFRTVEEILSFDGEQFIISVADSSGKEFFTGIKTPDFLTNVPMVDAMFQTGGMLDVLTTNDIILPYNLGTMRLYDRIVKNKKYICITDKAVKDGKSLYQIRVVDNNGKLIIEMVDFEMVKIDNLEEENQIKNKIIRK